MHGVPIAAKDLCHTTDAPTGGGSTIHADFTAPHDATVVSRLRAAAMFRVVVGADRHDPTALSAPVPDHLGALDIAITPRIGVDRQLLSTSDEPTQRMLDDAIEVFQDLGWTVSGLRPPDLSAAAAGGVALCGVQAAHAHAGTYPARAAEYGEALAGLIDVGLGVTAVRYQHLLEGRRSCTGQPRRTFLDVDVLLLPGMGFASPDLDTMATLGTNAALLSALLVPTAPFDLTGMPTVTLPGGWSDRGAPLAIQLAGAGLPEQLLLQAAHAFQRVTDLHRTRPQLG